MTSEEFLTTGMDQISYSLPTGNGNVVGEESPECPLCMEPLDLDDISFYPCTCGYQVCKFCWHRMKTDENGLCPACRQKYPDDPVDFKPVPTEAMQRFKGGRKQQARPAAGMNVGVVSSRRKTEKDVGRIIDSRKHLATIRVVQKNLVFVIGLSPRLADADSLKRPEHFGRFGRIVKVMVNTLNANGTPASSASAYITYQRAEDALRAVKASNGLHLDGRVLKASLGTTKYCVNFLKNNPCSKPECMYLHELGDGAASFTKEEMQQGRHQEYEKLLLDSLTSHVTARNTATQPVDIQPSGVNSRIQLVLARQGSADEVLVPCGSRELDRRVPAGDVAKQETLTSVTGSASSSSLNSVSPSPSGSLRSEGAASGGSQGLASEPCSSSHSERASPSSGSVASFDLFVDAFDEFGFDPWNESSKGLADLMELETRSIQTSAWPAKDTTRHMGQAVLESYSGNSYRFSGEQDLMPVYGSAYGQNQNQHGTVAGWHTTPPVNGFQQFHLSANSYHSYAHLQQQNMQAARTAARMALSVGAISMGEQDGRTTTASMGLWPNHQMTEEFYRRQSATAAWPDSSEMSSHQVGMGLPSFGSPFTSRLSPGHNSAATPNYPTGSTSVAFQGSRVPA